MSALRAIAAELDKPSRPSLGRARIASAASASAAPRLSAHRKRPHANPRRADAALTSASDRARLLPAAISATGLARAAGSCQRPPTSSFGSSTWSVRRGARDPGDATRRVGRRRARAGADAIADLRERRHRLAAYTALTALARARSRDLACAAVPSCAMPGGKPRLAAGGAEFSLAHARPLALIGVSSRLPLGVDLETARPVKMSPRRLAEISAIGSGPRGEAAARRWARSALSFRRGRGWRPLPRRAAADCANADRARSARQAERRMFAAELESGAAARRMTRGSPCTT